MGRPPGAWKKYWMENDPNASEQAWNAMTPGQKQNTRSTWTQKMEESRNPLKRPRTEKSDDEEDNLAEKSDDDEEDNLDRKAGKAGRLYRVILYVYKRFKLNLGADANTALGKALDSLDIDYLEHEFKFIMDIAESNMTVAQLDDARKIDELLEASERASEDVAKVAEAIKEAQLSWVKVSAEERAVVRRAFTDLEEMPFTIKSKKPRTEKTGKNEEQDAEKTSARRKNTIETNETK